MFTLVIENRGVDYVNYDSNVDFFSVTSGGRHAWSESCGFARPAVVTPATISPGDVIRRDARYPSADAQAAACHVAPGSYSLTGRFRACRSPRPAEGGTYCDADAFVVEITLPIEQR